MKYNVLNWVYERPILKVREMSSIRTSISHLYPEEKLNKFKSFSPVFDIGFSVEIFFSDFVADFK